MQMKRSGFFDLKAIFRKIFSLPGQIFAPHACPVCGNATADGSGTMFCKECLEGFHFVRPPVCPKCGGEHTGILLECGECLQMPQKRPWKEAAALFVMTGSIKEVIYQYKYRSRTVLCRPLGRLAAELLREKKMEFDLITFIPLHPLRYLERGYNQSGLLGERLGTELGIPCKSILFRKKHTKAQARLKRAERLKNMKDSFGLIPWRKKLCRGKKILLIDDVMTTGATLSAGAEALLKAGAEEISIFILARRQKDLD